MNLVFGSDHAGLRLRNELVQWALLKGYKAHVVGAESEESYDYPAASDLVAKEILSKNADRGILVCGSGVGVCIRANRHPGIRAADCQTVELAQIARQHNHINVLCLGQRFLQTELAVKILDTFLNAAEDLGVRHLRRIELLDQKV